MSAAINLHAVSEHPKALRIRKRLQLQWYKHCMTKLPVEKRQLLHVYGKVVSSYTSVQLSQHTVCSQADPDTRKQ